MNKKTFFGPRDILLTFILSTVCVVCVAVAQWVQQAVN